MRVKNISERPLDVGVNTQKWQIGPGEEMEIPLCAWQAIQDSGRRADARLLEEEKKALLPQADINLVATFWASNGMGRVGEELLLAMDRLGYNINVIPVILEEDGLSARTLELTKKQYEPSEMTLFCSIPEKIPKYATTKNYLYAPWDTTQAPSLWVDLINQYITKCYPMSYFTEKVFKESGVLVPTEVVKCGVSLSQFPFLRRNWQGTFYFLTSGDLSLRKGTDALLEAFRRAFPTEDDVRLILKTNQSLEWGKIKLPNDERLEVITERLSPASYLKLLQRTHCFVFPSRAEGFGLPPLEAMATGLPLILHNWSGLSMMANDKYNFPIGSGKEMPAPAWHYPHSYGDIGNWRNPDIGHLCRTMRYVYEQRDKARAKGQLASRWVAKMWDWDKPVKAMLDDILGRTEKTWGSFYKGDTLTKQNVQDAINSHRELFWVIRGFCPKKIIESGTGTGEMAAFLTWKEQKIEGKEPTIIHPTKVIAIDNDEAVLALAKTNMQALDGKAKIEQADAFTYGQKADLIFSQGMLEHLADEDIKKLIDHQLQYAPILVHAIPNIHYGKRDYGNERLLPDEHYYRLFEHYDLTILPYWEQDGHKTQSILVFKKLASSPKVSIIMPVWNEMEMTKKAIECVRQHTRDYELIVIDNGSTDGIQEWLDQQKDIRVLHLAKNLGVPKAKNIGMALAKGEYICFLDNDTEVGTHWLDNMLEVFQDPTIGFTAHEGWLIDKGTGWFNWETIKHGLMDWASGSCFLFPRRLLKQTGLLLDKDQWCVEDVDFCMKIRQLGYRGKLPDKPVNIIHLVSQTARKNPFMSSPNRFQELSAQVSKTWKDFIPTRGLGAKVEIGVGDAPKAGYIHIDIQPAPHVEIVADTRKLPLPDNSVAELYNAHLIEHFDKSEVPTILKEWHRVLEPNGCLRIVCPDFLNVCRQIAHQEVTLEQGLQWIYGGKRDKYDYHYWGYNFETLATLLQDHGFDDIRKENNPDGWLQISAKKASVPTSVSPTIGFYTSHHHIYGGGENLSFRIMKILQDNYPNVQVISDSWSVDPKNAFGIEAKPDRSPASHYDIYINFSHGNLAEPRGDKNIAFIFYPQYDWKNSIKQYQSVVTLSQFCRREIKKQWGVDAKVISPPIELEKYHPLPKKKQILVVGRFFWIPDGNNKNQHFAVEAFKKLPKDWKLIFVGSAQNQDYFAKVKKEAEGLHAEFRENLSFQEMVKLYGESKILWHLAGYQAKHPSSMEHFGIVAVEALASGCIPLVFNGGGIAEIEGVETWETIDELIAKTLSNDHESPERLIQYAKPYSIENAKKAWMEVIKELCSP